MLYLLSSSLIEESLLLLFKLNLVEMNVIFAGALKALFKL